MKIILDYSISINIPTFIRKTLYGYLKDHGKFTILFEEDLTLKNNQYIKNGQLIEFISLRFPKEDLEIFRNLFFEALPPKSP
jgi:hypothetical protein